MMRIGRRVAKVMLWGLVLCLSILGGGLWFAYTYATDSETAARLIKNYVSRYLPGSNIDPGRVRLRPFAGELTLNSFQVYQRDSSTPTVRIPWLKIVINPKKLLRGQLELRQVSVVQPSLRLYHRQDGSLNLQGFLADPWPGPWLDNTPPIVIEHGTLEVVPDEESAPSSSGSVSGTGVNVLRDVSLKIEQVGGMLFRFEGSAQGDSLDRLQISGSVDLETGRTVLSGKLTGLTLSDALRRRIPREARPAMKDLGLTGGVVDIDLKRASYDPKAAAGDRIHYAMGAWLRDGIWECPRLPFPVHKLSALINAEDGAGHSRERAEGSEQPDDPRSRGVRWGWATPGASRWTCTSSWSTWSSTGGPAASSAGGRPPSMTNSGTSSSRAGSSMPRSTSPATSPAGRSNSPPRSPAGTSRRTTGISPTWSITITLRATSNFRKDRRS